MNREKKKTGKEFVDSDSESSDSDETGFGSESEDATPIREGVHEVNDPAEAVIADLTRGNNVPSHLFSLYFETSKTGYPFVVTISCEKFSRSVQPRFPISPRHAVR